MGTSHHSRKCQRALFDGNNKFIVLNTSPLVYETSDGFAVLRHGPVSGHADRVSKDVSLGPQLPAGHVDSLRHLTSEQAAVAMAELFRRTGSAQAHVVDPPEVRRLIRLDCRRRGVGVRTLAANGIVVAYDEQRRADFLKTDEGQAYEEEMTARVETAMQVWSPPPSKPPLRLVPPSYDA
jgi:hypothetical protein